MSQKILQRKQSQFILNHSSRSNLNKMMLQQNLCKTLPKSMPKGKYNELTEIRIRFSGFVFAFSGIRCKTHLRNMSGDYSDSEDDGPIPYKSDDESEDDDLARKIARRDTIAREKEINELKLKAKSNDMQTRKNDVSPRIATRTILKMII